MSQNGFFETLNRAVAQHHIGKTAREAAKQTKLLEQMAKQPPTTNNPPAGWYSTQNGTEWHSWNGTAWTGHKVPK